MQVIDFQETPVKKVRHQLLYLVYGDKDAYRHEAKFSILTALAHGNPSTLPTIRILTDRPRGLSGLAGRDPRAEPAVADRVAGQ